MNDKTNYYDMEPDGIINIFNKDKGYKTNIKCPTCDGYLILREGFSKFLGCSNYPKCDCKVVKDCGSYEVGYIHPKVVDFCFGGSNDDGFLDNLYPSSVNCSEDM